MTTTPDGRLLAVGTMRPIPSDLHEPISENIWIWDTKTGVLRSQLSNDGVPECVRISPDGRLVAAWWRNQAMLVELWDVQSCTRTTVLRAQANVCLSDVEFSPDGATLAVGAGFIWGGVVPLFDHPYGEVRLWNLATSKDVETLVLRRPVTTIAFSSDGRSLAAGCDDGSVTCWINKLDAAKK
jgi:WD40 repeat protein